MPTVAFIGAGQMGGRVARLLLRSGYELRICDPSPEVRREFSAEGVATPSTAAECAGSEVVIVFVMNGPQALESTLGPTGLLSGVNESTPPLVVIMSTIAPDDARRIGREMAAKGVRTIDAAVTGGLTLAEQGRLLLLVGGDPQDVEKAWPLLKLLGRESIKCGPLGAGLTAKVLNNMLGTSNLFLMQECYRLGLAYGLAPESVAAILEKGAGQNFWTRDPQDSMAQMEVLSSRQDYFLRVLKASAKDWLLAVDLAKPVGMSLPFLGAMIEAVGAVDGVALHSEWRRFIEARFTAVGA